MDQGTDVEGNETGDNRWRFLMDKTLAQVAHDPAEVEASPDLAPEAIPDLPAEPGDAEAFDPTLEDVAFEGRSFKAPPGVKSALMMHADYTRKTQELAVQRQELSVRAAALETLSQDKARLAVIDQALSGQAPPDWEALEQQDPRAAQAAFGKQVQMREARSALAAQIQAQEHQAGLDDQRRRAALVQEGHQALAREIPDWGAETQAKLAKAAIEEFGFAPEEISGVTDPRVVRLLHAACEGRRANAQSIAAQRHLTAQAARPASQVGAHAQAGSDPSRMGIEEWMRHRNSEIRSKGR